MGYLDHSGLRHFWEKIKAALSGKQDSLTAGDGISIQENEIRVTTPVKEVTQAEYDAIPAQERVGQLYCITDSSTYLQYAGEKYSTEELRIGTWIDGKPLYRKVITGLKTPPTADENGVVYTCAETETIVFFTSIESYDAGDFRIGNFYVSNNNKLAVSSLGRNIICYAGADWTNRSLDLILHYTKTTDQVVKK